MKKRLITVLLTLIAMVVCILMITAVTSGASEHSNCITFSSDTPFTLKIYDETKKSWEGILEYSTDLSTWTEWDGTLIDSSTNGKLYLRGKGNTIVGGEYFARFVLTGSNIACLGDIMTLLDYENPPTEITTDGAFQYLFYGCTALTQAPELSAETLSNYCYMSMFAGCTSLKTAPKLPAKTLTSDCYTTMFSGCTSLENPPELPATTLADGCYCAMFDDCTSLKTVPELSATVLTKN